MLDQMMSWKDGLSLASGGDIDCVGGFQVGADDGLAKSFSPSGLLACLRHPP